MPPEKTKRILSPEKMASLSLKTFLEKVKAAMQERRVKTLEKEWPTYRGYREGANLFTIVNYTKCTVYTVDLDIPSCNCQDYTMNKGAELLIPCKHMLYAAHVLK